MNTRDQVIRNTLFSSLGIYTEYFLGMLTSIIIARHLGPADFGAYSLVIWLVATGVVITNSGVASAIIKFVAELRGADRQAQIRPLLTWAWRVQGAFLAIVLLGGTALFLLHGQRLVANFNHGALLAILLVTTALRASYMLNIAIAKGYENFRVTAAIAVIVAPLNLLLILVVWWLDGPMVWFLGTYTASSFAFWWISRRKVEPLLPPPGSREPLEPPAVHAGVEGGYVELARVGSGELLTPEACTTYSHFCYVLTRAGRSVEALRIVDATNALAGDEVRESPEWASLQGRRAQYLLDAGRLREAYSELHQWIPKVKGFRRSFLTTLLQAALVLGDNMTITDAMAVPPRLHSKGLWMVSLALVTESPELLRASGEYLLAVEDENGVNRTNWSDRAFGFADLLDGRKGAGVASLARDLKETGASLVLSNTYHLHLRPGEALVREMGGEELAAKGVGGQGIGETGGK